MLVNLQAGYCTGNDTHTHCPQYTPNLSFGPRGSWSTTSFLYLWTRSASHTKPHCTEQPWNPISALLFVIKRKVGQLHVIEAASKNRPTLPWVRTFRVSTSSGDYNFPSRFLHDSSAVLDVLTFRPPTHVKFERAISIFLLGCCEILEISAIEFFFPTKFVMHRFHTSFTPPRALLLALSAHVAASIRHSRWSTPEVWPWIPGSSSPSHPRCSACFICFKSSNVELAITPVSHWGVVLGNKVRGKEERQRSTICGRGTCSHKSCFSFVSAV